MIQRLWREKDKVLIQLRLFCCIICLSSGLVSTPFKNKSFNLSYNVLTNQIHLKTDYNTRAYPRKRRNVMQMARMVKCMSGCNPLSYRGYGCYCGYMGSGQPVDEIDRCCLQHDWCYAFISCPQTFIYFVPYTWQCMNPGAAHCNVASVPGVSQECATQLCECDREFAQCVSKFPCPRKKPECKTSNYVILQTVSNNDV